MTAKKTAPKRRQIATTKKGGCRSCKRYPQWLQRRALVMEEEIRKAKNPLLVFDLQLYAFVRTAADWRTHLERHAAHQQLVRP